MKPKPSPNALNREVNFYPLVKDFSGRPGDKRSDAELWSAFRQGDEAAFVDIYKTYVNKLYNYGTRFCRDHELVKDCLQDFFIYLRKNRETLGDTSYIKFSSFQGLSPPAGRLHAGLDDRTKEKTTGQCLPITDRGLGRGEVHRSPDARAAAAGG